MIDTTNTDNTNDINTVRNPIMSFSDYLTDGELKIFDETRSYLHKDVRTFKVFCRKNPEVLDAYKSFLSRMYIDYNLCIKDIKEVIYSYDPKIRFSTSTNLFDYAGPPKRNRIENDKAKSDRYERQTGFRNAMHDKNKIEKSINTQKNNHDGKLAFNTDKQRQTCLERYGFENPMSNKEVQQKVRNTFLERYGVDHNFKDPEVREKIKETNRKKYGCDNAAYTILAEQGHKTKMELYVIQRIKEEYEDLPVKESVTRLIPENTRYEVDIYIPNLNLGFEINGGFHDRSAYEKDLAEGTMFSRERIKEIGCKENDIDLYNIWNEDYETNEDCYQYVKSIIDDRLRSYGIERWSK